jgi:hypothetical protein
LCIDVAKYNPPRATNSAKRFVVLRIIDATHCKQKVVNVNSMLAVDVGLQTEYIFLYNKARNIESTPAQAKK